MSEIPPGTLMILYGPYGDSGSPQITWMIQGEVKPDTIATASAENIMVRDFSSFGLKADYRDIARQATHIFTLLRDGVDVSDWATHMLDPEQRYQVIIPIKEQGELI